MASGGNEVAVDEKYLANFLNRVADKLDEQAGDDKGSVHEAENTGRSATDGAHIMEFDMDDLEIDFESNGLDSAAVNSVESSASVISNNLANGAASDGPSETTPNSGEDIEDLLTSLMGSIQSTGWLENNSVPKWNTENPELAEEFKRRATNPEAGDFTLDML